MGAEEKSQIIYNRFFMKCIDNVDGAEVHAKMCVYRAKRKTEMFLIEIMQN